MGYWNADSHIPLAPSDNLATERFHSAPPETNKVNLRGKSEKFGKVELEGGSQTGDERQRN